MKLLKSKMSIKAQLNYVGWVLADAYQLVGHYTATEVSNKVKPPDGRRVVAIMDRLQRAERLIQDLSDKVLYAKEK